MSNPGLSDTDLAYLDEVEARCNGATEGPWDFGHHSKTVTAQKQKKVIALVGDLPDAEFIVRSRTDIPRLIAMVRGMAERAGCDGCAHIGEITRFPDYMRTNCHGCRRDKRDLYERAQAGKEQHAEPKL